MKFMQSMIIVLVLAVTISHSTHALASDLAQSTERCIATAIERAQVLLDQGRCRRAYRCLTGIRRCTRQQNIATTGSTLQAIGNTVLATSQIYHAQPELAVKSLSENEIGLLKDYYDGINQAWFDYYTACQP